MLSKLLLLSEIVRSEKLYSVSGFDNLDIFRKAWMLSKMAKTSNVNRRQKHVLAISCFAEKSMVTMMTVMTMISNRLYKIQTPHEILEALFRPSSAKKANSAGMTVKSSHGEFSFMSSKNTFVNPFMAMLTATKTKSVDSLTKIHVL